ncbi:MAG: TolC family protein [Planctomycetota bacterium]
MTTLQTKDETLRETPRPKPAIPRRRGGAKKAVLLGIVVAVGVAVWWGRAWIFSFAASNVKDVGPVQTYEVKKSPLVISVTEEGNVESASNVELKCQVEGGSQILYIIPEGTQVTKGTELVRLDSSAIEEQVTQQKIEYEKARSLYIEQEEKYAVASIAVTEYVEGTYLQELQTADANIVIAKENLKSAQNILEHSERMFRKGYINQLQLETSRFSVQRSQLDLDAFLTARKVLTEYTKSKKVKELESLRDSALAAMMAQKAATELEQAKLDRLTEQLRRCTIVAPQPGMVIYANESGRWGQSSNVIEEGAMVREFQTIIRLPDLSQMQVKTLVHESKVEMIQPGMRAHIRIRDRDLPGTVVTVASQPEQTSFFSAQVKEYATVVRIDGSGEAGLKPGMTAEVKILVDHLADAISVPLLGLVEIGGKFFCFVQTKTGPEKRAVVIGKSNDTTIEIKDGLAAGDRVILNPRATIAEAREASPVRASIDFAAADLKAAGEKGARPAAAKPEKPAADKQKAKRFDLMSYDKDKDGKVSESEAPEQIRPMFSAIDGNKDGFIDVKEFGEARAKMRQRQQNAGGAVSPPTD